MGPAAGRGLIAERPLLRAASARIPSRRCIALTHGTLAQVKRKHNKLVLGGVTATILLVAGGLLTTLLGPGISGGPGLTGRSGVPAPSFTLQSIHSSEPSVSLTRLRGKDVVINFWASWCIPCRVEMPLLEDTYREHHATVEFLGIDTNDSRRSALGFLDEVRVTYPVLYDPSGKVANAYGLLGMPTTVFIDSSGIIRGRHSGQLDPGTIRAALHQAFGL